MRNTRWSFIMLIVLSSSFAFADLNDGLVAHWNFDEGSGATLHDSVNSHDGTIYGAAWTQGVVGSGLRFDGSNDYVRVADHSDFDFPAGFTLSAWVKPESSYREGRIVYRYDFSSEDGYFISQTRNNGGGYGIVTLVGEKLNDPCVCSYKHSVANQWQLVTGVREDNGDVKIYVDGELQNYIRNNSGVIDSSGDLFFGIDLIYQYAFLGTLDDIRIYNRALTSAEIAQLVPEPSAMILFLTASFFITRKRQRQALLHWAYDSRKI